MTSKKTSTPSSFSPILLKPLEPLINKWVNQTVASLPVVLKWVKKPKTNEILEIILSQTIWGGVDLWKKREKENLIDNILSEFWIKDPRLVFIASANLKNKQRLLRECAKYANLLRNAAKVPLAIELKEKLNLLADTYLAISDYIQNPLKFTSVLSRDPQAHDLINAVLVYDEVQRKRIIPEIYDYLRNCIDKKSLKIGGKLYADKPQKTLYFLDQAIAALLPKYSPQKIKKIILDK